MVTSLAGFAAFESVGGGSRTASWGDYDNDGDLDVFVGVQPGAPSRLFKNNGDGTFTLVAGSVVEGSLQTFGSAWADIDNDTDLDLLVSTSVGTSPATFSATT